MDGDREATVAADFCLRRRYNPRAGHPRRKWKVVMIWPFSRQSHPQGSVGTIAEIGPFLPDRFAFKLFRELVRSNNGSNVFFSPFSVLFCLMMVWEGASGETREVVGDF